MKWRPFVKCVDCGAVAEIKSFSTEEPFVAGIMAGEKVMARYVTLSVPEKCPACQNKKETH